MPNDCADTEIEVIVLTMIRYVRERPITLRCTFPKRHGLREHTPRQLRAMRKKRKSGELRLLCRGEVRELAAIKV